MRTALAAALAVAAVLTVVSVVGVLYQRDQLIDGVALVAEEQARTVAASLESENPPRAASAGGESALVQVIGANGRVVVASPALVGRAPLFEVQEVTGPTRGVLTGLVDGEADRYLSVAVPASAGRVVVAAQSLETVDAATSSTIGLLSVGGPLLVLLVGGLGFILAGRALRPVEQLRAQAAEITAADLSARLPVVGTGDEIEHLSLTLNEMLGRLESSADAQRRFVADASHELRSPIATIRTLHEVALTLGREAGWATLSDDVLAETQRLERLVGDLLILARSGTTASTEHELLDLSAVVREETLRARSVRVITDISPGALALGRPDSLARAVRNVLDNAERHTRSVVEVSLSTTSTRAVLRIRDDGDGIVPEEQERIFDRFVRLDEARARDDGGSGLGLAITRHIVEAHAGTIRVHNEAAAATGALFVIELPLAGPGS